MSLAAGTRLGPYEIVAPLGAGGMGEVYRAHDARLKREVAIKVLPAALAHDAEALRRLEQEAHAIAALNHPNLLTVYDVGKMESGAPYLVCELLEGETLRQKMTPGKLPQRKAVEYAVQMAYGLAAAHAKGIVHRDLKPDNIFCTSDGRVKILDFGLAKLVEQSAADDKTAVSPSPMPAATMAGVVLGTAGYMAPEQARGLPSDARSDIFSFGAVFYEMLSGRRAFRGDTALDVITAILREEPPELATSASGSSGTSSGGSGSAVVSPALERVVRHCLEKEPQLRFQSAGDIAFSLTDLSQSSASGIGAVLAPARRGSWFSPRRLGYGGAGFGVLVLAAAGGWMLGGARAAPPPGIQRLTYQQGLISDAHFLPDGQGVIGSARWNEAATMAPFTVRLDSIGVQALAAKASDVLAVSPTQVAVLQNIKGITGFSRIGTLALMPLAGGAPRPTLDDIQFADFSPAGDLAITRFHPQTTTYTLEYPVGKVLYQTNGWIGNPRFSRDGKRIAFIDHPILGDDNGRIAVVSLGGQKKNLTFAFESAQGLAWSPSGDEIWFTASQSIARTLQAVSLSGRIRPLLQTTEVLTLFDVLPDGRALVNSTTSRQFVKLVTPTEPRPREFSVLDWPLGAELSADGKQVLIGDQDSGPLYSTFLRGADGSAPTRLGDGDPLGLSPDGNWAVSLLPTAPSQLMLLPVGTGEPRQLTHSAIAFLDRPVGWLPGATAFIAEGNEPGHQPRAYRVSLAGEIQPVTPPDILGLLVTPDGKSLLAMHLGTPDIPGLYPLAGAQSDAPARPIAGLQAGDGPLRFSSDGAALYLVRRAPKDGSGLFNPATELWRLDLRSGKRTLLATATTDPTGASTIAAILAVSADGGTYAYEYGRDLSQLILVSGLR